MDDLFCPHPRHPWWGVYEERPTVERDPYVVALIAQALDDIDEHRFSIDDALNAVADAAWAAGWEAKSDQSGIVEAEAENLLPLPGYRRMAGPGGNWPGHSKGRS